MQDGRAGSRRASPGRRCGEPVLAGGAAINPFQPERHTLLTPLQPPECHARLRAVLAAGPFWRRPVFGEVAADEFHVWRNRGKNSFQPHATGRFVPVPDGTRVELCIGISPLRLALGLGLLVLVPVVLLGSFFSSGGATPGGPGSGLALPALAFVLVVVVGGTAAALMALYQQWHPHGDRRFLVEFLRTTLDAQETLAAPA